MNSIESRSVLNSEPPRAASGVSEPRVIKKYPNRRLYDTVESRYITLTDIRRLVMEKIEFVVIDKKNQDDITRSILLQVIADQEHSGEPLMSQDFLAQVIRSYGGAMQSFVGAYLEHSLKALSSEREHLRGEDMYESIATITQKNLERWRSMQEDMLRSLDVGDGDDEEDAQRPDTTHAAEATESRV